MPVDVYRDNREAARSAVIAHAGFDLDADLRIARFSENVDIAKVHAGAAYHSACLILSGGMIRLDRRGAPITPGSITVEPTWFSGTFTNDVQTDWLTVYVKSERLEEIGNHLAPGGRAPDVRRVEGEVDPVMVSLIRSCAQSLLRPTRATRMELDGWAQIFGAHLLRAHSDLTPVPHGYESPLSPKLMRMLLEFIEAELEGDLSLATLANTLGIGTTRLSAGFRAATGRSLHQYVIERRVERARDLIDSGELPLSDIAFAVGFSSQSHLTSHFRQRLGITPGRYRRLLRV